MALGDVVSKAKLRVERARADHGGVDIGIRTFRRFSEDDGGFLAASLTYYTFFSIFPLLIVAASALGYLTFLSPDLQNRLLREGIDAVPLISEILSSDSIETLQEQRGTLAIVGLALALYTGSGAITALEHALNRIYRVRNEPGPIPRRIRSLKWLAAAAVAVVITVAVGALGPFAGGMFGDGPMITISASVLIRIFGAVVSALMFIAAFRLLPAIDFSWREVLPGAIAASVALEVLKLVGGWYLARGTASREETFGAFNTAAALLVASYLLAQITLLAAELNAVLAERRTTRQSALDRALHPPRSGQDVREMRSMI
ncbi:MAG TPA: YihY/virulence factor BrkB family protein [Actinomycetota bacterium]|nr:YihY/virulence factor BrkB family protein [Actinomycetota bacterium]